MDYAKESLRLHGEWKGKIEMVTRVPVKTKDDLSLAYTPGVAQPCLEIQKDLSKSYELTRRWNMAAVITDGSAVQGFRRCGRRSPVRENAGCGRIRKRRIPHERQLGRRQSGGYCGSPLL